GVKSCQDRLQRFGIDAPGRRRWVRLIEHLMQLAQTAGRQIIARLLPAAGQPDRLAAAGDLPYELRTARSDSLVPNIGLWIQALQAGFEVRLILRHARCAQQHQEQDRSWALRHAAHPKAASVDCRIAICASLRVSRSLYNASARPV